VNLGVESRPGVVGAGRPLLALGAANEDMR
jgi:hypothetical protein